MKLRIKLSLLALSCALAIGGLSSCQDLVSSPAAPTNPGATLTSIAVSPDAASLAIGATKEITVTATYSDGTTATIADATWTTSAAGVATVATGTVTAVAAGSATITATKEDKTATVAVTVNGPVGPVAPVYPADTEYYYSTVYKNASTPADLSATWDTWGSGTVISDYTTDATYNPVVQLKHAGPGGWGTCVALTSIGAGKLAQYTTLHFLIKPIAAPADGAIPATTTLISHINVKVPASEKTYALSSGTLTTGGWIQMNIPLSDFAATTGTSTEFAILNNDEGTSTFLITNIGLSGKVATVVKTALGTALTNANALQAAHVVGTAHGNVPLAAHNDYAAAITSAQAVKDSGTSTQSAVDTAVTDLAAATTAFKAAILVIGPTAVIATPSATGVIALHNSSGTYTNIGVNTWQTSWSGNASCVADTTSVAGKSLLKLKFNATDAFDGVDLTSTIDITGKTTLHIDYWTPDGTTFKVQVVDFGANGNYDGGDDVNLQVAPASVTKGSWQSIELDFSAIATKGHIAQLLFLANGNTGDEIFWLDNVYFH